MKRLAVILAAIMTAGCVPPQPAKDGGKPTENRAGNERPRVRQEVEAKHPFSTHTLWNVYASDAVAWKDKYAGRLVNVLLSPPLVVQKDGKGYHVLQPYQDGRARRSVAVYLREDSARRLSKIIQGEEKVSGNEHLCVKAAIADDDFAFSDGELVILKRP